MTRRKQHPRKRGKLKTKPDNHKRLSDSSWFRGLSVLGTFTASTMLVYSLGGPVQANAISLPGINDLMVMLKSVVQADKIAASFNVNTAQTAQTPRDIGRFMYQAGTKKMAVLTGENTARKIAEVHDDLSFGRGITDELSCGPTAERTLQLTRNAVSGTNTSDKMIISSGSYTASSKMKASQRSYEHLNSFCDITEVRQGLCVPQSNGLGGADSNYNIIAAHTSLTPELEQAAYAYMLNISDPAKTKADDCDSHACDTIKVNMRVYNSLSSMSQTAYMNQINDSLLYNVGSSNNGSSPADTIKKESDKIQDATKDTTANGTGSSEQADAGVGVGAGVGAGNTGTTDSTRTTNEAATGTTGATI